MVARQFALRRFVSVRRTLLTVVVVVVVVVGICAGRKWYVEPHLSLASAVVFGRDTEPHSMPFSGARSTVVPRAQGRSIPSGESPTVRGQVQDALGGVVVGAKLEIIHHSATRVVFDARSDHLGGFAMVVPSGRAEIRVSAVAYAQERRSITVPADHVRVALMPEGFISGVVRAPDGAVPAEVWVQVWALDAQGSRIVEPVVADRAGAFVVAGLGPGMYTLEARGLRHHGSIDAPLELTPGDHIRDVEIQLEPAAEVFGRVVAGSHGEPCEHGWVRLSLSQDPVGPLSAEAISARTMVHRLGYQASLEPAGGFRLNGVRPGNYDVALYCSGHTYKSGPRQLQVQPGQLEYGPLSYEMAPAATLLVHVWDGRDRPASGVALQLTRLPTKGEQSRTTVLVTDDEGDARTGELPAGRYRIATTDGTGAGPVEFVVAPGQVHEEQTLRLVGSAILELNVVDADGRPAGGEEIEAAIVQVTPEESVLEYLAAGNGARGAAPMRAMALGGGRYRAGPLVAGSYRVQLSCPLSAVERRQLDLVELQPGMERTVVVHLSRRARIEGRVFDVDGSPVSDAWVTASAVPPEGKATAGSGSQAGTHRALTDPEGYFALSGLSEDARYLLATRLSGGGVARLSNVVADGRMVMLRLQRSVRLEGELVDATGAPIRAVAVQLTRDQDEHDSRVGRIVGDGSRFIFDDLPSGKVHLLAIGDQGRVAQNELEVPHGVRPFRTTLVAQAAH